MREDYLNPRCGKTMSIAPPNFNVGIIEGGAGFRGSHAPQQPNHSSLRIWRVAMSLGRCPGSPWGKNLKRSR
jgi:hypothetical protein